MNFTDYLRLSELKIFKNVRDTLPKGLNKSSNLLTIRDGVLYTWNFADSCILTLNLKAARTREGDNVTHQSLLPLDPVPFQPELLIVNDSGTLLVVAGPSGILVMELPTRYPPYGAFEHNKDVVYCRSHTLDERLLLFSDVVQVRQVRFHPGSIKNNHILALTSDNTFRLYSIQNSEASCVKTFKIGELPVGNFPGTKTSYLAAFGEVGVDFDFGQPELSTEKKPFGGEKSKTLCWPAYVLHGNGMVFSVNIPLDFEMKPTISGPLLLNTPKGSTNAEACSIICVNSNPEIVCIGNSNGTIYHSILLPISDEDYERIMNENLKAPQKELICFESIELELGLSTAVEDDSTSYTCPIFLHKDDSRPGRYFATHAAGIHSVTITCFKDLQNFSDSNNDESFLDYIFNQESKAEYVVCTKTASSNKTNPVIGFCLYYEPTSLIAILADANIVSLGILTIDNIPANSQLQHDVTEKSDSPLKKMLREPLDLQIQKILKRSSQQPILKLGGDGSHTQKECYELLQRAQVVFGEYFENHARAKEEIEKRVKALRMMKDFQLQQINQMNAEKQTLQEEAENLAEKYEDIKDKQDEITKRCEKMLIMISQRKLEPSDAEKDFLKKLGEYSNIVEAYKKSIEKLKMKKKYQELQIGNRKAQEMKKESNINETHANTIKTHLKESSDTIAEMIQQVNEFKERLNLN